VTRVVTFGSDTVKIWDFERATLIDQFSIPLEKTPIDTFTTGILNREGDLLLVQHGDRGINSTWEDGKVAIDLVDLKSRQIVRLSDEVMSNFRAMAFSESGHAYAIAKDHSILICQSATECRETPIDLKRNIGDRAPRQVRFNQDTGALAIVMAFAPDWDTASRMEPGEHYLLDKGVDNYDAEDYSIVVVRRQHGEPFEILDPRSESSKDDVANINLSENARGIYVAFSSGLVKIVQLTDKTRDRQKILRGHLGDIAHVSYNAEKYQYLTFGTDGTIRFWDENPLLSWDAELGIAPLDLNPDDNPDFVIRTDILAEAMRVKKDQFLQAIEKLLMAPDFVRIRKARDAVPRCLHPEQRQRLGLDQASPRWCEELGKWPAGTVWPGKSGSR
jgi:WD40 repeat protein